jgi:hypothetical protein
MIHVLVKYAHAIFGRLTVQAAPPHGVIIGSSVNNPEPETRRQSEDEPMLYCPVCSSRLTERKCKLLCEKCGYYMSCADYY